MIFQHTIDKVLSGEKTQTRRLVKPGQIPNTSLSFQGKPIIISEVFYNAEPFSRRKIIYELGKTYAVQPGRGKPAVARIRVTGLRREDVRTISDDDVKAEGFSSRDEFLQTWIEMHSKASYRVVQEMLEMMTPQSSAGAVTSYCQLLPAETFDAWVIEFELCKEAQS